MNNFDLFVINPCSHAHTHVHAYERAYDVLIPMHLRKMAQYMFSVSSCCCFDFLVVFSFGRFLTLPVIDFRFLTLEKHALLLIVEVLRLLESPSI